MVAPYPLWVRWVGGGGKSATPVVAKAACCYPFAHGVCSSCPQCLVPRVMEAPSFSPVVSTEKAAPAFFSPVHPVTQTPFMKQKYLPCIQQRPSTYFHLHFQRLKECVNYLRTFHLKTRTGESNHWKGTTWLLSTGSRTCTVVRKGSPRCLFLLPFAQSLNAAYHMVKSQLIKTCLSNWNLPFDLRPLPFVPLL